MNRFAHFKVDIDGPGIHFIHETRHGSQSQAAAAAARMAGLDLRVHANHPDFDRSRGARRRRARRVHGNRAVIAGLWFLRRSARRGMNIKPMAEIFHELMTESLGYQRYAAQGGDWGASMASRNRRSARRQRFRHASQHGRARPRRGTQRARADARGESVSWRSREIPPRRNRLPVDPGHQAADPGLRAQRFARRPAPGSSRSSAPGAIATATWRSASPRIRLLTNVMIYWITETINSSTRLYYEARHIRGGSARHANRGAHRGRAVPRGMMRPPRHWAERAYNLKRWTVMPNGGHFAAMEEPELLARCSRVLQGVEVAEEPNPLTPSLEERGDNRNKATPGRRKADSGARGFVKFARSA